jgi:hypothetical protein
MTIYVKGRDGRDFHWCQNCSRYPRTFSAATETRPRRGLCAECLAKERGGDCRP